MFSSHEARLKHLGAIRPIFMLRAAYAESEHGQQNFVATLTAEILVVPWAKEGIWLIVEAREIGGDSVKYHIRGQKIQRPDIPIRKGIKKGSVCWSANRHRRGMTCLSVPRHHIERPLVAVW